MRKSRATFRVRVAQILLIAPLVLLLAGAGDQDARFNKLGHQMMCMCGCGQILLECNHVGCSYSDRMRNELTAALQRGDNDNLILQSFVQNYGATVLAAPIRGGFDAVAWITPIAVFVLATGLAVWVIRIWMRRPAMQGASVPRVRHLEYFREQARKETEL